MDRKRAVTAILVVACLGGILSTIGSFIASGLDQGGSLYNTLSTASLILWVLCIVGIAFYPDVSKAKQSQSEAESDSSLL
jgi:hypothetical protein